MLSHGYSPVPGGSPYQVSKFRSGPRRFPLLSAPPGSVSAHAVLQPALAKSRIPNHVLAKSPSRPRCTSSSRVGAATCRCTDGQSDTHTRVNKRLVFFITESRHFYIFQGQRVTIELVKKLFPTFSLDNFYQFSPWLLHPAA